MVVSARLALSLHLPCASDCPFLPLCTPVFSQYFSNSKKSCRQQAAVFSNVTESALFEWTPRPLTSGIALYALMGIPGGVVTKAVGRLFWLGSLVLATDFTTTVGCMYSLGQTHEQLYPHQCYNHQTSKIPIGSLSPPPPRFETPTSSLGIITEVQMPAPPFFLYVCTPFFLVVCYLFYLSAIGIPHCL